MHSHFHSSTLLKCHTRATAVAMLTLFLLTLMPQIMAQTLHKSDYAKLSPMLRTLVRQADKANAPAQQSTTQRQRQQHVCAFVQTCDDGSALLSEKGCTVLAQFGDIAIADIPVSQLSTLASNSRISRIEAEKGTSITLDSMSVFTNATPVYEGYQLPHAFTGRGVVMGIMDIGFDLTHPTFYNTDATEYRISRLWDQLSADTIGSPMPVGAEYTSQETLLSYGHSRDALTQYHGTHTLGIAAGSGAGTKYQGMAPESDICLVSNAVTGDEEYIDSADIYKYTYATDALGFKYIFDYADSQGKPCVISFSEGSKQDLHGDDMLYYEVLKRMTGQGHIIVSSAGNNGTMRNYVNKPLGQTSAGTFMLSWGNTVGVTTQSGGHISVRTTLYNTGQCTTNSPRIHSDNGNTTLLFSTTDITTMPDSCLADTLFIGNTRYILTATAYPSCYDNHLLAMDITLSGPNKIGYTHAISIELIGKEGQGEMFSMLGEMGENSAAPLINDAECSHNINSPASAPVVICVGGTACRAEYTNTSGEKVKQYWGKSGERGSYSSIGPTFDGRTKPDVMAPGANIISALSGTYMALHGSEVSQNIVATQTFRGREYGWLATGGTSMSSPAVGGIIALWLQANPKLTPDDIMGVIARTSKPCGEYGERPNNYCGYGMIDAYAGLLDILGMSRIEGLTTHHPQGINMEYTHDNKLIINRNEAFSHSITIRIYDTNGLLRLTSTLPLGANRYEISLNELPSGVYAIQIDSRNKAEKGSILIRKD